MRCGNIDSIMVTSLFAESVDVKPNYIGGKFGV